MEFEFAAIIVLVAALLVWLRRSGPAGGRRRIRVDGEWRSYSIDRPRGPGPTPSRVLLCFHGGLGHPGRLRRHSGIREAALQRGYTVIFPEAPGGWIDARPELGGGQRDTAFVDALLLRLRHTEGDGIKVFLLGLSNGGMFVHRLAMEAPQRFAAVATLLASIPAAALRARPSGPPAAIAMVFGRDDRIMPWAGGLLALGRRPGIMAPAEATLSYWLRRNQARGTPLVRRTGGAGLPVELRDYPAVPSGAPVRFVSIEGWGHQWPRWSGEAAGDGFDVADVILDFFDVDRRFQRPPAPVSPLASRDGLSRAAAMKI